MAVRRERGRWMYRTTVRLPDGRKIRVRGVPSVQNKQAALSAERAHIERLISGRKTKEVPTFKEFAETFMRAYAPQNSPSERYGKQGKLAFRLLPRFGSKRLDEINRLEIDKWKASMLAEGLEAKSVNNYLATLSKILRYAVDAEVLERAPRVGLLPIRPPEVDFLEEEELDRLLVAADPEPMARAAILLGADAGLRAGEICGLLWSDVDLVSGKLVVRRSDWMGRLKEPKGRKAGVIPMTQRLGQQLRAIRHLGQRVITRPDGSPWTLEVRRATLPRLCKRAGLRTIGWHVLRHTFAARLAREGAPAKAIQELMRHGSIAMTNRYMHLGPSSIEEAVSLLEKKWPQIGRKSVSDT